MNGELPMTPPGPPPVLVTRTSEEFFALCRRADAGELAIAGVEVGIQAPDPEPGRRRGKRQPGWTFHVYYPQGGTGARFRYREPVSAEKGRGGVCLEVKKAILAPVPEASEAAEAVPGWF